MGSLVETQTTQVSNGEQQTASDVVTPNRGIVLFQHDLAAETAAMYSAAFK